MDYQPSPEDVQSFVEDYARDFGVTMPAEDAHRILVLYEELCVLFEKHSEEAPIRPYTVLP